MSRRASAVAQTRRRIIEATREGVAIVMAGIRSTLERYRVTFDSWFLERGLHELHGAHLSCADGGCLLQGRGGQQLLHR